ncbi:hypothetical protein ACFWFB_33050, partial [Streptomyces albidoflavus]
MKAAPSTMQWIRRAGQRLSTGSSRLATHLAARMLARARRLWHSCYGWVSAVSGIEWLIRMAVLVAVAWVVRKIGETVAVGASRTVADGGAPWLMWGSLIVWILAAYRCGHPDWKPKPLPEDEPTEEAAEESEEEQPVAAQAPAGRPPVSPVALVAAVRDIGTPHAQLRPLAEYLGTTTDAVRAAAAELEWPVKDVRMDGRSSSAGLHWGDCPYPPPLPPLSGVVG